MPSSTRASHRDRYRLFESKPAISGALVTRGSSDNAGIFNYTIKREWRRDLDIERRREGYDYFWPNQSIPIGGQPFPSQIQLDKVEFSGGVVTATRAQGHYFSNNETIIITGANNPAYNGTFPIFNITATTFQYSITGAPPSPDLGTPLFAQALEPITMVSYFERPNGQGAVVAGSPCRLYRYFALEDPNYISENASDYPLGTPATQLSYWTENPNATVGDPVPPFDYHSNTPPNQQFYIDNNPGYWIVIGSGFTPKARRWETVAINGYMVFNNGVDLPVTYRVEEMQSVPIYELREQGIASIGTISQLDGILMGGDISEIHADKLADWFNLNNRYVLDSLTNNHLGIATATVATGHTYHVGENVTIREAAALNYNGTFTILSVTPTTFTYRINGDPPSPDSSTFVYSVGDPYGPYTDMATVDRTQYRLIWGTPDEPRRWAESVLGAIDAGSNVLLTQFPVKGFSIGQEITITGAGPSHPGGTADNLAANIIFINDRSLILDQFAQTSVIGVPVVASDSIGSIVGFEDLQDDGSAILKMAPLADQMVIYKATCIFLGQYLGNPNQPFAFSIRRIVPTQCIFYRNTLIIVETPTEMFHIYAGAESFYRFDLSNQQPMIMPHFESCSDIFYDQADLSQTEMIFSCDNGITQEILFALPPSKTDSLWYDYKQTTMSTTAVVMTSGSIVQRPRCKPNAETPENWFIFGTPQGAVLIYGRTEIRQSFPDWNNQKSIFFYRGAVPYSPTRNPYTSLLMSGLGGFGNDYSEKDIRALVPLLDNKSPNTAFTMAIYGAANANGPATLLATQFFANPMVSNLFAMYFRQNYFKQSIQVDGMDNPMGLVGVIWNLAQIDSRSAIRI